MDSLTTSYSMTLSVRRSNPTEVHLPTRSEPSSSSTTWSIEIIQASRYAAYQKMSDHMMSNEYAISTRVGCGRVHPTIENILDKCGVVAPNLPTKIDDLSHSTGHGWTTREKVIKRLLLMVLEPVKRSDLSRLKWSSYDYCLVLDQRCSVSPTTSTLSGRVTTTAWSSTSDIAFLQLPLLLVVEFRLHQVLDQRCNDSPTTSTLSGRVTTTAWSSTSDVAFLPLPPTTSTLSGRVTTTAWSSTSDVAFLPLLPL
uniref:Uncharacterized protein n=1 Tax=Oryza sativa subsp. japonica TaxID=39947 RepID=Q84QZ8_ORYSJ|nr:hypothetical protein [Oryza sativa Japonica Group]AAR87279.1 hypothetical protein [Oryza sativa Japonica Group]